jgi:hypothetical protein
VREEVRASARVQYCGTDKGRGGRGRGGGGGGSSGSDNDDDDGDDSGADEELVQGGGGERSAGGSVLLRAGGSGDTMRLRTRLVPGASLLLRYAGTRVWVSRQPPPAAGEGEDDEAYDARMYAAISRGRFVRIPGHGQVSKFAVHLSRSSRALRRHILQLIDSRPSATPVHILPASRPCQDRQ